jgi:hypothetical protein
MMFSFLSVVFVFILTYFYGIINGELEEQSRYRSTAPLPRGASGEEGKFTEMPKPPLVRGGGTASAVTERFILNY